MPARLLLLVIATALAAPAFAQSLHPKIAVSEAEWRFGEVDQGFKGKRVVTIENVGEAELRIQRVGITCGCLTAAAGADTLQPGESTEVVIELDTTLQSGHLAKHVFIDSNDPSRTKVLYLVAGVIRPVWWPAERSLHFGEIDPGESVTRRLRIEVMPGRETEVTEAVASDPAVTTVIEPWGEVEGPHGFDLVVTLSGDLKPGVFRALLEVRTDDPLKPSAQLALQADVRGALDMQPDRIRFGGVKRGETKTVRVRVYKRRGEGLVIERASCGDKRVTVSVEEVEPGRAFDVVVTLSAEGADHRVDGRVVLITNDPDQRLMYIPFQGAIRP